MPGRPTANGSPRFSTRSVVHADHKSASTPAARSAWVSDRIPRRRGYRHCGNAVTWLHMKVSGPVGDVLNVGSGHAQKPVRQIRQGAGNCEFLADLRHVLIRRVTTG